MRKNSVKNTRVNGEVHRVLAEVIRSEIKDPRINPMTSVVSVEVAPRSKDLQGVDQRAGDGDSQRETLEVSKVRRAISEASWQRESICGTHPRSALSWTNPSPTV